MDKKIIYIGADQELTPDKVRMVAYDSKVTVKLSPASIKKIVESRNVVERIIKTDRRVYGINTGFGKLKDVTVSGKDLEELQKNLIISHSSGVGKELPIPFVRAAMLIRAHSLAHGFSGVRVELIEHVCNLLNKDVIPVVPSQGSVGSSGDLAPLSHMGLIFWGRGEAYFKGERMSGAMALKRAKMKEFWLAAKEGLAWNNGTAVMTAIAALSVFGAKRLLDISDMATAITLEAICGTKNAFSPEIHSVRPHLGQKISASRIKSFITGSKLVDSQPDRLQDSYSLRCSPQVHGAARDAFAYVESTVLTELNSVTDNPVVFPKLDNVISGGNFHGEPIAIAMDVLGILLSEIANISERRTAKLLDPGTSEGLPAFLIPKEVAGLNSGFMIAQYAAAALVSENKVLAHPASVDSIPTSANQEDHVSMGTIAARKGWEILQNAENVLSIELFTAAQAVDFRDIKKLGNGTAKIYRIIRSKVKFLERDRELAPDINSIRQLISEDKFVVPV